MKTCILLILLLPLITNAKLENVENNYLVKAIQENDIEKFKEILKKAKDPFKFGALFSDADEQAVKYSSQELQYRIANSGSCKDNFISEMLKYGYKPLFYTEISSGGKDLSIWQQLCPKTIEMLLPFFEDELKIKIGEIAISETESLITKFSNRQLISELEIKNGASTVEIFTDKVKATCITYDIKNKWCALKDKIDAFKKNTLAVAEKLDSEEKSEEYANSPAGLAETVCDLKEQLKTAQAAIDRQKEIGKASGFVDKEVLHVKGATIVDLRTEIKKLNARYREKTKKNMNEKCN